MWTNIAFYKFVTINEIQNLRTQMKDLCLSLNLKGTIILGKEGINSCLVGQDSDITKFIEHMQRDTRFADIHFKKSFSEKAPFRRMIVKLKKEIIPIGSDSIQPEIKTGQYVSPQQLKSWYENNEDMVILDTRNDYEVALGTFRNAVDPKLKEFRTFPEWIRKNFSQNKKKKVVTFCTGGIRCEKATAFMMEEGFENVYQVEGGILNYLEQTKNDSQYEDNFYDGDCFVFDNRVAVDKNLNETSAKVCYHCWHTLQCDDLKNPQYRRGEYCPHCIENYLKKKERLAQICQENNAKALAKRIQQSQKMKKLHQKTEGDSDSSTASISHA